METKQRDTVGDTTKEAYKHWTEVQLRYGDTDRQGHVNNAVFCTLFESGRVGFLFDGEESIAGSGKSFVIVRLTMDFLAEMNFPGSVQVGSRILKVGKSSFTVGQALFKDDVCAATSESVIVMLDDATKRSSALSQPVLARLESLK